MFRRWECVKIQAARNALEDGRIDDALLIAGDPAIRGHRRASRLLDELERPLLGRARLHAQAGRYAEALADLDRLKGIGRGGAEADALRERVVGEIRNRRGNADAHAEAREQAAARLEAGRLESGRLAVERLPADDARRAELERDLDVRVRRSEQLVERARAELKAGQLLAALRSWEEARQRHGRTDQTERFAAELAAACRRELSDLLARGALERFLGLLRAAGALRAVEPSLTEFESAATLATRAAAELGRGDYAAARRALMRLASAAGEARWIKPLLAELTALGAALDRLYASPLGVLAPSRAAGDGAGVENVRAIGTGDPGAARHNDEPPIGRAVRAAPAAPAAPGTGEPVGFAPLLLLIDGTGSSLIVRRETVRIGRAGSGGDVEVPIPADCLSHHADIVRHGEDYFLMAQGPTQVNQQTVTRTMLRDGDRIALGGSARLTFRRPSDRSASAVLLLSDRCRAPQDVDRVVLMAETFLIGPDASCHVRTREGDTRLVGFVRNGRLCFRRRPLNGRGEPGDVEVLELGQTKDIGDLRLTLKAYDAKWSPVA